MAAKLTLLYEVDYPQIGQVMAHTGRFTIVREFPTYEVTIPEILDCYEALLRAAGFHCPPESLDIVSDESLGSSQ